MGHSSTTVTSWPWRESICDVVTIPEDADGHIDAGVLGKQLERYADRSLRIGAFSAASNVTGIITDTTGITKLLHAHHALAFWDFAAAAPYVDIDVVAPDQQTLNTCAGLTCPRNASSKASHTY